VLKEMMALTASKPAPFAKMIKEAREGAKLTQAQLADAVGCPQQTIEKIERGITKTSGYFPRIFSRLGIDLEILAEQSQPGRSTKVPEKPKKSPPRKVYLREWRKFMNADIADLARIAGGDIGGYQYLEQFPYKLSMEQMANLAEAIGISPEQVWFPPKPKD
jgi:DNA-binding XRE family transcriptional regulator